MYAHSNTAFSRASTTTTTTLHSSSSPPIIHDSYTNNYNKNSYSSGNYNAASPSSVASTNLFMQKNTLSSNSLNHHNNYSGTHYSLSPFFSHLLHSDDAPVRRVYSTGDIHRINRMQHNHSSLSSECSIIIEGMNRACRYSPDEKKARIERYRSKRNQRNFNKKIKYACRKTLADSRPRIRGRFARNEETDNNPPAQWNHIGCGDEEEYENWVSIYDSLVASNLAQESQESSSFGLLY
ncbi:hypothetical protein TanjilG_30226 [Lupinus angustifolius]|uniref:CCT domain-containing protein n=1 Tax=Lupinus angustifolius TaxID=3871 RepID=A0A4P1R7D6_LUPAN|nr:PREDICTED: zinc finger protein CONSTANS-LIKE 5-like [Lupinus angustifolius]OIW03950.1 hypothetical protein TanjilG_30226 [Lupinus angustifolius]